MLRSRSLLIYGLGLVCALLFILQFENWPTPFVLETEVQPDGDTMLELLYDQGFGYRHEDSIVVRLPANRDFAPLSFRIRVPQIHNLSLLVYNGNATLRLRHTRIKMLGRQSLQFNRDSIRPGKTTTTRSSGDVIEIAGAKDEKNVGFQLERLLEERGTSRRLRHGILPALCGGIVALLLLLFTDKKNQSAERNRRERLLRNATVIFLVSLYLSASVAKLNGSATALWRIYADRASPNVGILLGTPKAIRSDEWVGATPWILSQVARGLPVMNPGIGEEMMPLLNNLPARHWTMLFRPQMWAFFVADLEHAFAFYWNFKWFSLLLGAFLFFRLIARGSSLIGLFGALFLFFSPFVQWWFSTPTCMPEMIAAFFLALWSAATIARAQTRWAVVAAAVLLVQSVAQFVFCAYPRFQIPLIYLALFLIAAGLTARRHRVFREPFAGFRVQVLATAALLSAVVLLLWYKDLAPAISRVHALAYPGSVFSTGGGLPWQRLFMPFLEFAMTGDHYPADQMNSCEAAGFLFLGPLLAVAILVDASRRRFDPVIVACLVFILVGVWFTILGFSTGVSRWTGFWLVYAARMVLAVNVASIIGVCRYLSDSGARRSLSPVVGSAVVLILGFLLFGVFQSTNSKMGEFVSASVVISTSFYFAAVFVTLWQRQVAIASLLVLIPTVYSTGLVNPVGIGLPGLTTSGTFQWLSTERERRPDVRWIVVGHSSGRTNFLPQFVKATGADTFGGYRCEADRRMVRALDPTGKFASIYNRYAEIQFRPSSQPEPEFELTWVNHYNVLLPLKPEILRRLGVACILEVDMSPAEGAISGYSVVGERNGLRLLRAETPL